MTAEPTQAISPNATHSTAITGFAFDTASMTSSGRSWVKITDTAMISSTMVTNDRMLNREIVTGSIASDTSCGARARSASRSESSSCLLHGFRARVAAGMAAFCTNGSRETNVSSPHTRLPADTVRSTPISADSSASSCTLSMSIFALVLVQSPLCHPAMIGVPIGSRPSVSGVMR